MAGRPNPHSSGSNSPLRPMSSFQPASSLPRDMNAPNPNAGSASASSSGAAVVQPRPRPLIRGAAGTGNTVLVNNCQRGNPVLQHIRNIGWEYADIVPDYQVGISSCVLFLSIRYHRLHPEYVHTRIQKLAQMFTLRILLVLCDVNDHQSALKELTKTALINNLTLILAWSAEEAGRYIETYKSFEFKPPDLIKERVGEDYLSQVTNVLTQVRGVNRTDVVTLLSRFGSLKRVVSADQDQLSLCPGFGEVKAKRLREVFSQPFRVGESRSYSQRKRGASSKSVQITSTASPSAPSTRQHVAKTASSLLNTALDVDLQVNLLAIPSPPADERIDNPLHPHSPSPPPSEDEQLHQAIQLSLANIPNSPSP